MDDSCEHYAKSKKPATKDHILCDSIYKKMVKIGKKKTEVVAQSWENGDNEQ